MPSPQEPPQEPPQELPQEITSFEETSPTEWSEKYIQSIDRINLEILFAQLDDIGWRIKRRGIYGALLMLLLFLQNATVFILVYLSFSKGNLQDLQLILGTLVAGTLIETAYTVNIIIRWLFSDIVYKLHKYPNLR